MTRCVMALCLFGLATLSHGTTEGTEPISREGSVEGNVGGNVAAEEVGPDAHPWDEQLTIEPGPKKEDGYTLYSHTHWRNNDHRELSKKRGADPCTAYTAFNAIRLLEMASCSYIRCRNHEPEKWPQESLDKFFSTLLKDTVVRELDMAGVGLDTENVIKLVEALEARGQQLFLLDLSRNTVGPDKGADAVARLLKYRPYHLREMDLNHCELGTKGMLTIITHLHDSHVHKLGLENNGIGDDGPISLSKKWISEGGWLHQLDLSHNKITDATPILHTLVDRILHGYHGTIVTEYDLRFNPLDDISLKLARKCVERFGHQAEITRAIVQFSDISHRGGKPVVSRPVYDEPLRTWTPGEVREWVEFISGGRLSEYGPAFQEAGIDGARLLRITDDDLRPLIGNAAHRIRIFAAIKELRSLPQHDEL
eukprot:m.5906 g.5906  ORF g.5906 m.5906 type:complete len:424 (-) comp2496_c0_seq1:163-1434(-)